MKTKWQLTSDVHVLLINISSKIWPEFLQLGFTVPQAIAQDSVRSTKTIESVGLSWDPVEPAQAGYTVASGYRVTYELLDSAKDPILVTDLLTPSVSVVECFVIVQSSCFSALQISQ